MRLVHLLATPLRVLFKAMTDSEDDVAEIRRQASRPPADVVAAGDALLLRTFAWLLVVVLHLPVAVLFGLVDGALPKPVADAVWLVGQVSLAVCALTAVLTAIRFGMAYRLLSKDDAAWEARRGRLIPGNRDLIAAVVVVLAVTLLAKL